MVTSRASSRKWLEEGILQHQTLAHRALLAVVLAVMLIGGRPCAAEELPIAEKAEWHVGVASAKITPEQRLHMAGYAARKEPAEGTQQELFAKAMAIEDQAGTRVVFVTLDLIGVREELQSRVAEQVEKQFKLPASMLLMNASHTHSGPAYEREDAQGYLNSLVDTLVDLVGRSLAERQPAELSYSFASCSVAMNRRTPSQHGFLNHPNPNGPTDHTVPVLSVRNPDDDSLRAILFGYACHNTTLGLLRWQGDYAGYAQEFLERDHPGVTAMFMMGCGGDQNPYPRRELKYVELHGQSLATAVEAALESDQKTPRHQRPIHGNLSVVNETVDLEYTTAGREDFAYPIQVIRFGDDLMLIALGSEVVVDYALRLKSELAKPDGPAIWVAGYSNAYNGYIPSKRVLKEGGYEALSRPWKLTLEERIVDKVHELVGQLPPPETNDASR
ncbi:Neutral ceramidase precursor [Roseimaritima multifibrata]|uniref:Neutral ceramidase n=1 Tax=Roseimaritima multifibrata TaxID=1930274 RepID=A0A517MI48_9BACT|nr:neutral/alkaline non-lysosomal ceramidase N-terminal domain-containing protein [Roseimaritima multifibrata]QDS94540.1 Neutral ceramidase precursor [Roseimaritima multifibrata]